MKCLLFLALVASATAFPSEGDTPHVEPMGEPIRGTFDSRQFSPGGGLTQSLFSLGLFPRLQITFTNAMCPGTGSNANQQGVCLAPEECNELNGRRIATCATGFGACCRVSKGCGDNIKEGLAYFETDDDFTKASSICKATIQKANDSICQIKLEFEEFILAQPSKLSPTVSTGACPDNFQVNGGTRAPAICGMNTGQHMYVDFPHGSDVITIDASGQLNMPDRKIGIKIIQIACDSPMRAPLDCLQYYNSASGTIRSFNFPNSAPNDYILRQLPHQDYKVCIKRQAQRNSICYNTCSVNVQNAEPENQAFSISYANSDIVSGAGTFSEHPCPDDYLLIPGAYDQVNVTNVADRFCGENLNPTPGSPSSITVCSQNFDLYYHTDGSEDHECRGGESAVCSASAKNNNQGFCLTYSQI
ncbi:unnamed protein product [Cyprideis torosa]|uniref:Uncharacterized protein n=1 Tax=Cyprideis torosa TaxID=163714 RepID=A0A7R8W3Q1_9CRUS|nr:unnamed protein product [Cyprideis torosa]CAG0879886.1 unnamed protein product [Cyprideis torosa]